VQNRWSRRRFLKTAGAGGLGLLSIPALAAARTQPRSPISRRPFDGATARFGAFSEPVPPEKGYMGSLEAFETEIGRQVAVYRSYRNWGQKIINPTITHLLQRTPPPRLYLSVHAFFDSKAHNVIQWADIANGLYDAEIDSWSNELLTVTATTPVYMCFHHEMENEESKCGSPTDFQNAYWYFRNRVEVDNAVPNLTWVVTYMGNTFRGKHGGPDRWWPDTPQFGLPVDQLMGVDLYNRNLCHYKTWRWFDWLAVKPWQFATQVDRPFFVGECGSVEGNACDGSEAYGVAKEEWFIGPIPPDDPAGPGISALGYMRDTAPSLGFTPLEAFCYSNVNGFNNGSYRIDTSADSIEGMATLANDPFFAEPSL
jgi:hypothetical protein